MNRSLLKLFPLLLLFARPTFAQSPDEGLHLLAGPSLSQLELEGGTFQEERYLGVGLSTNLLYQLQGALLGLKSTAMLGAHNHEEELEVSESEEPVRRYIQHVNFSPYIGYQSATLWQNKYGLQLELGTAQAMTSLRHKDDNLDNAGAKRKKSSFISKGYELAFGLYKSGPAQEGRLNLMFSWQVLRSERQYLVDVSEFRNALTLAKGKSYGVQDVHNLSFVISYYLF